MVCSEKPVPRLPGIIPALRSGLALLAGGSVVLVKEKGETHPRTARRLSQVSRHPTRMAPMGEYSRISSNVHNAYNQKPKVNCLNWCLCALVSNPGLAAGRLLQPAKNAGFAMTGGGVLPGGVGYCHSCMTGSIAHQAKSIDRPSNSLYDEIPRLTG